ncbi:hypothetical protein M2103_000877 [Ereboglobus sp. PH5-5]|uniref:DUF1553 domain-containing protein n=1 Tax=Ereboglobus sp. PH5-5 TaxID=2940529 RepID=UPI00240690D4|nr:DUF1553 domain-containing protein [Ereboglobus sp. PH5-5]MDF9832663.1 hypothetical protein [Ereboglobus sp. PH5-5]
MKTQHTRALRTAFCAFVFCLIGSVLAQAAALKIRPESVVIEPGKTKRIKIPSGTSVHSNDSNVARIKSDGTLEAVSPGRAVLSFRSGDDYATVFVTVKQTPPSGAKFFTTADAADAHPIDMLVNKNLRQLGVLPSPLCSDSEFLRRACLDLTGALPPLEKTREFLADTDPQKREKLIDWIFSRPEYADYWAMKWSDVLRVKSEFPSNLWPNAVQAYHNWLRGAMAGNMRYDEMARTLLTTAGSNFRDPPCNFYRATQRRTPAGLASAFALIFMGARLDCAECKEHPYQTWQSGQAAGLAAFFTNVKYKKTGEWKEEIVYFNPSWSQHRIGAEKNTVAAPVLPDGTPVKFNRADNPQKHLVKWLTSPKNPYFARHVANRYWCALFGRGITMPVDDVRPGNPPANPELLDLLAEKVVSSGFDLRALLRFIVTSQTYQRSSAANESNARDSQNWSHYIPRRLDAEVLADAIGTATGAYEYFESRIPEPFAMWPDDFHSVANPDASVTSGFLETFGRPGRDTSHEVERDRRPSMAQALYLFDSEALTKKLRKKDGVISQLAKKHGANAGAFAEECYLTFLARMPTGGETSIINSYFQEAPSKNTAAQDVVWALINTKEFLYNH